MVYHIILADILLIARMFPRPCGARKNTTQLAKYPRVLYDKPSNKMYLSLILSANDCESGDNFAGNCIREWDVWRPFVLYFH